VPTLAASFLVTSASANTATLTTPSFTPALGDVIVVKFVTESNLATYFDPTDTNGHTYADMSGSPDASSNHCWMALWTTTATVASAMTVSVVSNSGAPAWHSMVVEQWSSAVLAATPAVNGARTGTGNPSSTLVTTLTGSVVTWVNGDFAAVSPSGRVYDSTSASPNEDGIHDKSTANYVAYYAWQDAASPASQTIGLTSPGGQTWTLLGIEITDAAGGGGGSAEDPDQFGTLAWQ
jgi:hypothetical protein